ncbi:methyltransferase domain-containing protein (plasmid) [Streptosporangium sp. CA-135522]|uniref:methyltransferase domain-containing protein n=1 Tax=Streptosporangium sp. CA-135522 TaxID=3240072 RepID=UPI003D8EA995
MTGNTWASPNGELADSYDRHGGTLRGALRHALIARALHTHLPAAPQRVLDIGGGGGQQALALARAGHHVTVLDPDPRMLQQAETRLRAEPEHVRERIILMAGTGEQATDLVDGGFDVTCCHGVLMYGPDPRPLLTALVETARPGGVISVATKQPTLAMRAGLSGQWDRVPELMDATTEVGNLGVLTYAHPVDELSAVLDDLGTAVSAWYGVRIFTDHLDDTPMPEREEFDRILEAEWQAGLRDPYRRIARMIHLIARAQPAR